MPPTTTVACRHLGASIWRAMGMTGPSGKRRGVARSFRRSGSRWWLAACVGVFVLIGVSAVFTPADEHGSPHPAERVVFALLGLVALWIAIGIVRQGIYCTQDR